MVRVNRVVYYIMDIALHELIRISNLTGKDPALVQGGGGNTSTKTGDGKYMYIKASGTALKDMDATGGWRRLRLDAVRAIISDKSIARLDTYKREAEVVKRLLGACDDDVVTESRPSVEAHLHAFLDRVVIHLHPLAVAAYVNAKNGKTILEKLFADARPAVLWVPYVNPGFALARTIAEQLDAYQKQHGRKPRIIFLEKHGLFISAGSSGTALRLLREVLARCNKGLAQPKVLKKKPVSCETVNDAKLHIRRAFFTVTGKYVPVAYYSNEAITSFMHKKDAPRMLSGLALSPDELVYANGPALWVDDLRPEKIIHKLNMRTARGAKPPPAFLVKDIGLFVAAGLRVAPVIKDIAAGSFFIRSHASGMGGINALNKRQSDFINKWEGEVFRMKVAAGAAGGDLQDRIAVVTGAGSGLGRSIAMGLALAGSHAVIADIDAAAAQETQNLIKAAVPQASNVVISCDVTSEDSVDGLFRKVLENFGGLDILVNAAGIAPAGPLVELPVDKWRLALEVNLTGYFLAAKAAARIMLTQGMGGSIINLSSKSGLEASKDNTAYNATKAGEIHIARGWALELGEHGIRVNSVCPGNVFEGSKIWNADYIGVCAKKYGIKPDEVIPYYVNKTCLKREIKGQDVADAVVFLCSDKARTITGQILVPDSGQVMVR